MTTGTNQTPEPEEVETGSQPLGDEKFKIPNRWIHNPRTRQYLYGIGLASIPLLVSYGVVNAEQGGIWIAFLGAVLGVTGLGLGLVNTVERPEDKAARLLREQKKSEETDPE